MPRRAYLNDLTTFPILNRNRDIYYPGVYEPHRAYAYDACRRRYYDTLPPGERKLAVLRDKSLDHAGDLGWTLEYATAWCYRHLNGNQTGITDAVNHLREIDDVDEDTPFIAFDILDRALFNHKLEGMVYLRWKSLPSCSPGITSAPGVVKGIPRVCIELNRLPFEAGEAHMDDLLDALIHQMIHAFFLIACGAQTKTAKPDDRLMDGLHFGVILFTIRDITRRCYDGALDLIFYAANRTGDNNLSRQARNHFISLNPRGSAAGLEMADGQSHCGHDNRYVRPAQMQNWQVERYSVALDLGMDSKGDKIYDLDASSNFNATERLKGPPSSTYVELIWDDKRVMVPRESALKYSSLKKPLEKDEKMELKVPDCSFEVFCQLYNYFTCGGTKKDAQRWVIHDDEPLSHARLAPLLAIYTLNNNKSNNNSNNGNPQADNSDSDSGVNVHLQLFKVAEAMKFEELERHVLKRLWQLPYSIDNPIKTLQHLYNDQADTGPVHAELHRWARAFLLRCENDEDIMGYNSSSSSSSSSSIAAQHLHHHNNINNTNRPWTRGWSNYEKLLAYFGEDFREMYHRCAALRDDCRTVAALLSGEPATAQGVPVPSTMPLLLPTASASASASVADGVTARVTDTQRQRTADFSVAGGGPPQQGGSWYESVFGRPLGLPASLGGYEDWGSSRLGLPGLGMGGGGLLGGRGGRGWSTAGYDPFGLLQSGGYRNAGYGS
ncbi:hypothetical protein B0A50_03638 [Salinomyces thailandicus]|uniref:SprT-like domain-containing protein n=1 Tax=Salinomyces thailandicus TaxID=706561 RepID=A0A4U0U2K9_9PEZI|nr:hypothetical protein B0A50_03638 [Salinomyces thailandica]